MFCLGSLILIQETSLKLTIRTCSIDFTNWFSIKIKHSKTKETPNPKLVLRKIKSQTRLNRSLSYEHWSLSWDLRKTTNAHATACKIKIKDNLNASLKTRKKEERKTKQERRKKKPNVRKKMKGILTNPTSLKRAD